MKCIDLFDHNKAVVTQGICSTIISCLDILFSITEYIFVCVSVALQANMSSRCTVETYKKFLLHEYAQLYRRIESEETKI